MIIPSSRGSLTFSLPNFRESCIYNTSEKLVARDAFHCWGVRRVNGFKSWKTSGHFCDTPSNGRCGICFYLHQPVLTGCKRKKQRLCSANYTSSSEGWKIPSGQSLNTTRDSCFTKYFLHTFLFRRSVCQLCRPLKFREFCSFFFTCSTTFHFAPDCN